MQLQNSGGESAGRLSDEGQVRFRILELFTVLGVIAFAIVSLKRADQLFETLFFSFALLVILVSVLLSIGRRAGARVFWIAFGGTSTVYLIFAHVPDFEGQIPRHNGPEVTTQLLRLTYNWLHSDTAYNVAPQPGGYFFVQDDPFGGDIGDASIEPFPTSLSIIIGSTNPPPAYGDSIAFMRIGHSTWALLLGWLAGHFTWPVYERSRRGFEKRLAPG